MPLDLKKALKYLESLTKSKKRSKRSSFGKKKAPAIKRQYQYHQVRHYTIAHGSANPHQRGTTCAGRTPQACMDLPNCKWNGPDQKCERKLFVHEGPAGRNAFGASKAAKAKAKAKAKRKRKAKAKRKSKKSRKSRKSRRDYSDSSSDDEGTDLYIPYRVPNQQSKPFGLFGSMGLNDSATFEDGIEESPFGPIDRPRLTEQSVSIKNPEVPASIFKPNTLQSPANGPSIALGIPAKKPWSFTDNTGLVPQRMPIGLPGGRPGGSFEAFGKRMRRP
jgi:hypothetical protein